MPNYVRDLIRKKLTSNEEHGIVAIFIVWYQNVPV